MGDMGVFDETRETQESQRSDEPEPMDDSLIKDLYVGAARELVASLYDPVDKELCSLWLDFITLNLNEVPVIFDYLKLFLLSLHQTERMPPFNDAPPPIDEIENIRIDVISMGRKMIENYRTFLQEKNVVASRKEAEEKPCGKESIPLIEFSSSLENKEYFATQRIPMFGRQCFFTSSPNEVPFWWPLEPGAEVPRDYLSRIAWFMYWQENKRMATLNECTHKKSVTTRTWWKDAVDFKRRQDKDSALGFRWHPQSLLPHSRAKLDKKQIEKFFKSVESKGLEVFSMDENIENIKERPVTMTEKLSISDTIKDILDKRGHGTVDAKKTPEKLLQQQLKEEEYNRNWYDIVEQEDVTPTAASESAENFLRKIQEHSIKRLLQTSPEHINVEDEARIKQLKELYSKGRTGDDPPPPSPEEMSSHDLLRRGVSWNIPAFKRTYIVEGKEPPLEGGQTFTIHRTPSPQARAPEAAGAFGGEECEFEEPYEGGSEEFGSPSAAFASFGADQGFDQCVPTRPTRPRYSPQPGPSRMPSMGRTSPRPPSLQPSPCKDRPSTGVPYGAGSPRKSGERFSMGGGSLGSFGAQSRQGSPLKPVGERFSMGGGSLGSFGAGSGRGSPVCREERGFSMGGGSLGSFGAGSRKGSPTATAAPLPPGTAQRESLGFANAQELEFHEQFLLPTADVEFDEEAQEMADPWGGYDDVDDDWVAPPEIEPEGPYEIGLPPVGARPEGQPDDTCEEVADRREGRIFMPTTERRVCTEEDLGPIEWPETEHLHDINFTIRPEDPPFDFLDEGMACDLFPEEDQSEFEGNRWADLGLIADQLGFQNFRL